MEQLLYNMIFKRKSFHLFVGTGTEQISNNELNTIKEKFNSFKPLVEGIKIDMKIVHAKETSCKRGQEYCIYLYSEKKDNYLQNIGYIGEQLDLYLASLNIGALWFGIGKVDNAEYDNLNFVIMIAIKKVPENKFRKDMYKSKRKSVDEIWAGNNYTSIGNIVRFAPSACNSQPWYIQSKEKELILYRYKQLGKRGIMPMDKVDYYNKIDIGIFSLFIDLCLNNENIEFDKEVFDDINTEDIEKTLIAKYILK